MNEDKTIHLRMLTPDRILLDEPVSMIVFRTTEGDMGIMPGHEPCAVMLDTGIMTVYHGAEGMPYLVDGGFALVDGGGVTVLSALAERADRMEALLEDMERQHLKRKSEGAKWENELVRAEAAIRRVLAGQETSAYSILKGTGEEGEPL